MGTIAVKWVESKLMVGADSRGHTVAISTWPEREPAWLGLKPSDMLLMAAASCSLYDVVEILRKQREPLVDLEVICTGTQLPEPPSTFTKIHLDYRAKGALDPKKLERAIQLSQEKYCSVITTLRPTVEITHEYSITAE
jgi:putative redox protein